MRRMPIPILTAVLMWLLAAAPAAAQQGLSNRIVDRIAVQLLASDDDAGTLAGFIAALESDPVVPNLQAIVLDSIPHRRMYLIGLAAPPETDLEELELDDRFAPWLVWGEPLWERDAPEGSTGSTWIDGIAVGEPDYRQQYAQAQLGLGAAHGRSLGSGVVVAVLDTGIDPDHPLLADRLLPGGLDLVDGDAAPDDVGNGFDDDGDGLVDEMTGHGTYVAGLLMLVAPEARILPVRVLDSDGNGDTWRLLAGLVHAIEHGVEVINLSLRSTSESPAVNDLMAEARGHGIVVVAAAGNWDRGTPRVWPAMDDLSMGVAAVDDLDRKAGFSNFHEDLFLSAPGASRPADGESLPDPGRSIISTLPGGGFAIWEGTSMAVPLVSGAVALVRAQLPAHAPDGDLVELIEHRIEESAVSIDAMNPGYHNLLGEGRLDAAAAVALGPVAPDPADLDGSGAVDFGDLLQLLADWGLVHSGADLDGSGRVDFNDLLQMLDRF